MRSISTIIFLISQHSECDSFDLLESPNKRCVFILKYIKFFYFNSTCVWNKMPRSKRSKEEFYLGIVKEFPNELTTDKTILYCKVCKSKINAEKRSQVTQHLGTKDHKNFMQGQSSSSQQLITNMVVQSGLKFKRTAVRPKSVQYGVVWCICLRFV